MFASQLIPYSQTNSFNKIVIDYLNGAKELKSFYAHLPSYEGVFSAIEEKKKHFVDRGTLVQELQKQYAPVSANAAVTSNIELLKNENTFTVCTAHQPNLFTGPLYFMYKYCML